MHSKLMRFNVLNLHNNICSMISSKITGTGTFIPSVVKQNTDFLQHEFLNNDGSAFDAENTEIIKKFKDITCLLYTSPSPRD